MVVQTPHDMPVWKRGLFQVASGGTAGFVEVCIMQPLDVVKTRIQLQNKTSQIGVQYSGMLDCMTKMYRNEGFFSFWKGVIPPILVETPQRAVKFTCFEQFKPLFMFGSPKPIPMTFVLSGLCAGLIGSVIINPFEVVKVLQQADRRHVKTAANTWTVTKHIIQKHGFGSRGLYKGLPATMARAGLFNTVYFGFYHNVKDYFVAFEDATLEFFRKFFIGFLSGTLSCLANTPFDVAKSRIQGPQPEISKVKYGTLRQTLATVYKEEGFLALYKGLLPKMMRLGPGGAILLLVFEYVYDYLQESFG